MSTLRKSFDKGKRPREAVVLAGAVAGLAEICCTYPLDTLKLQMQVSTARPGMAPTAMQILHATGPSGMYFGIGASLAQVGGKVALRFALFDYLKKMIRGKGKKGQEISAAGNLAAGMMSGAVEAVLWTAPTERLKILQQSQAVMEGNVKYASTFNTLQTVLKEKGPKGLYLGTAPTIFKQSASVGVRFWLYNIVRGWMVKRGESPAVWQTMVAGAGVGCISAVCNQPFDVVKSRMQAFDGEVGKVQYKGTFSGIAKIVKEEGLLALMKGVTPRFLRVGLAQGITFAVYEGFMSWYCMPSGHQVRSKMSFEVDEITQKLQKANDAIAGKDIVLLRSLETINQQHNTISQLRKKLDHQK